MRKLAYIFAGITKDKQAEVALPESDEIYRTLYDSSADAIMMLDEKGFFDCNNATLRIFGYLKKEDFIKIHPSDVSPPYQPDGADSYTASSNNIAEAFKNGTHQFEWMHRRQNGGDFPADVLLTAFELKGRQVLQATVRDITEHKQTKEELDKNKMMLTKAQELGRMGSWEWDLATNNVTWSKEVYIIHGLDPGMGPQNHHFVLNTLAPECKNDFIKAVSDTLNLKKSFDGEYIIIRPDGIRVNTHTKGEMIYDSEGHPVKMYGMVQNITQRKKLEEKLSIQSCIASIFITIPDDEIFDEVLKVILWVMQSPLGIFGYLEDETLVVPSMTRDIWNMCNISDKTIRFPKETWGNSSWSRAILEKRIIYSNEASTSIPDGHVGIQRHISLPILLQGEVIGLFQVANKETDYTKADLCTLNMIADHVAPILNARLQHRRADEGMHKLNAELEQRVAERTVQLKKTNDELEQFNDIFVGRELRMIELKEKMAELEKEIGELKTL